MGRTNPRVLKSEFSEYHGALRGGRTTCEEAVREELRNVKRYNGDLNAFILVFGGEHGLALSRARALDAEGRRSIAPLFGIPLAIKDNFALGGFPTTGATYYFRNYIPGANAELVDSALGIGAVPLGKTNMHEIALGATSAASYFGPVRNPYDRNRVSGGSSGGSAVAVAKSKVPILGLGSDTGGSERVPAALCGIMGFKPTLGALSLEGVFPLSATLDHAGLLTRTMPDMARAWEGLRRPGRTRRAKMRRRKMRIGVPTAPYMDDVDKNVLRNFWRAMEKMRKSGKFEVVDVKAGSRFERFTTARGEIQLREAAWFFETLVKTRAISSRMNRDVITLLQRGMRIGAVRYMNANLARLESIRAFGSLLDGLDALAMPTTRTSAPLLSEVTGKEAGSIRKKLLQNTEAFNLCGFPALSVPSNPGAQELPTAIQFAGRLGEDDLVLKVGELSMRCIAG